MNRFCERCERITVDGNLWCDRVDCPAEEGYPVLVYGEYLGDLKVTKLLRVWRTAALYEAKRGEKQFLLKVAHKGDDCEERLKREAVALYSLVDRPIPPVAFVRSFFPSPRSIVPVPVPPYPVPSKLPYGQISFRGEIKFFSVFKYAEGKFLSDLLLENPQMWHYQAAWIIITLTEALRPLAAKNRCHLNLSPDMVLVDVDKEGHLRPLLLDLGFILTGNEIESVMEWQRLCEPGYTPPELLVKNPKAVGPPADVYSMGIMFYEMLAGKAGFDSKLVRDEKIREAVTGRRGQLPVERPELESAGVVKVVDQTIALSDRHRHVIDFGKALVSIYGQPPREKRPWPGRFWAVMIILGIILLALLIVAIFLLVQVAFTARS
jgi:serine/threonine protein kinase